MFFLMCGRNKWTSIDRGYCKRPRARDRIPAWKPCPWATHGQYLDVHPTYSVGDKQSTTKLLLLLSLLLLYIFYILAYPKCILFFELIKCDAAATHCYAHVAVISKWSSRSFPVNMWIALDCAWLHYLDLTRRSWVASKWNIPTNIYIYIWM